MSTTINSARDLELATLLGVLGSGPGDSDVSFGDLDEIFSPREPKDPGRHPLWDNDEVARDVWAVTGNGGNLLNPETFEIAIRDLQVRYGLELEPAKSVALELQAAQVFSAMGTAFRKAAATAQAGGDTSEYDRIADLYQIAAKYKSDMEEFYAAQDAKNGNTPEYEAAQTAGRGTGC